jgi:hypothetical protein
MIGAGMIIALSLHIKDQVGKNLEKGERNSLTIKHKV